MSAISEGAYQTIQKVQPTLLPVITQLLEKGQTPKQIADFVGKRAGPFLAGIVEMAADYMRETNTQPNTACSGQGLCPECDSVVLPSQYCMMGHWCGERPATNASR